jgi:hypothetical protein
MDTNRCDVCKFVGDTAHSYAVHMKSQHHQRAVMRIEERAQLWEEERGKEAKAERFVSQWQPVLMPHYKKYEEAIMDTLGGIHGKPVGEKCDTLAHSIMQW